MTVARMGWGIVAVVLMSGVLGAQGTGLTVEDTEGRPSVRQIHITAPGVYRAEVWQASGGGIMKFYDLAQDPEAKHSLAGWDRGLFEVGWHGAGFKNPNADKKTCCPKHIRGGKAEEDCADGCGDWPSMGHNELKAQGELEVIEKSPVRVRVRAKSIFTWWSAYRHDNMPVTGTYTFYPTGAIVVQVRVENTGTRPFHWSSEYGPHLFLPYEKLPLGPGQTDKDQTYSHYTFATPKHADFEGDVKAQQAVWTNPEELAMASSDTLKTTFFITIPPEEGKLFSRYMRHTFPGNWDRFGYGSRGVVMEPGYDSTWACMIQMGTPAGSLVPAIKTAGDALPYATAYREPAKITGATLVTDDAGDLNKDGFNESEGCFVLQGPGPLTLTYEKGRGAGLAPVFKVTGWQGDAPKSVKVDGKDTPANAAVVDGKLLVQVMTTIAGDKATIEVGK